MDNKPIDRYNLISNHLQKIIIISDNILMISYADNDNAKYWHKYINNKDMLIKKIMSKLKNIIHPDFLINFTIDDIFIKYWDEGVHYYKPHPKIELQKLIKKLQNPIPNIYVGGEMLSLKQGWVEGCIESIDRLYKLYF